MTLETAPPAVKERANVLLVDDQPARLLSYEAVLAGLDANLIRAASGNEALQRLMEDEFAVILLDVNMPGMDGFETASLIHQHPRYEHTPIIFVTAVHVTDLDRVRAYTLGAVDYVYIPVIPEVLRTKVAVMVELYTKRRELETLNRSLATANRELARANALLEAEKTRELADLSQKLERAHAGLRLALQSARAGAWEWDMVAGTGRWSPELHALFGVDPQSTPPSLDGFINLIHREDRERIRAEFLAVTARGGGFDCEFRVVRPDSEILWISFVGHVDLSADGRPLRAIGIHRDISARKQAETALQASEERYRLATAAARCGTWDWNLKTGALECSGETLRLTGLDPAGFKGQISDFGRALHHEDRKRVFDGVKALMAARQEDFREECRLQWPDGSVLWVAGRGRFIYDQAGAPLRMVGVCMDITERKRLDESIKDANRRKDEFIATLAHELRNPLNPIRNAVGLLRHFAADQGEVQWCRDVIDRQVDHLTRLIDDLLDVSRITRNKLVLRRNRVELAEVIRGAVESSRPLIEQGAHELTVSLPAQPISIDADVVRLAQVFQNLLNNAAKYTPPGGRIELTAELTGEEPPGAPREVLVRVRDSGVGIAPAKLPQLFEMFYQGDTSLERSQGGLGIGLTLVRRLVELHGGRVEARSEGLGHGSEFLVRLPLGADALESIPARDQDGQTFPAGHRVLIADDNRDSAESLARLLRLNGSEVETAEDGLEAVTVAGRLKPDIVLLDIGMPKLNGYDAARMIRAEAWGKRPLLIALTGWGQQEDRVRSRDAGFDAHLTKPIDHRALSEIVAMHTGRPSAVGAGRPRSDLDNPAVNDPTPSPGRE
jgi:PAS domain S-box-containing protein